MTTKLAECAWEQGQIVKSAMSYDRGEKFLPSVVGNNYDWLRFKCYMGNVGLVSVFKIPQRIPCAASIHLPS